MTIIVKQNVKEALQIFKEAAEWLAKKNISSVVVRQINNPLAGLDHTLFSFLGMGLHEKKAFGFVACPHHPGFAEGLNVLAVSKNKTAGISNIEYTKFGALQKRNPHHPCKYSISCNAGSILQVSRRHG